MSLWSRPMRPYVLWLLAAGALFLVGLLYQRGNHVDHNDLYRVELKIKELNNLEVGRNLDVLKLLQRNKTDYDTLAVADRQARVIFDALASEFLRHGIAHVLHTARVAWEEKQEQIERFKRYHAVLANSNKHFVNLVEQLGQLGSYRSTLFDETARGMLVFLAQGHAEDVPALSTRLNLLVVEVERWPSSTRTNGRLLIAHGQVILKHHLRVVALADDALSSPFHGALNEAHRSYNAVFAEAERVARIYRTILAGLSLLLIAGILFAVIRLRRTASELERSFKLLDNIADHLDEGIVASDSALRLSFINRRGEELLGRRADELLGQPLTECLLGAQSGQGGRESVMASAIRLRHTFTGEHVVSNFAGFSFPALINGGPLPLPEGRGAAGYVASFRDLSEIHQAEARLRLAASVFDNLAEGMVITDRKGRIQSVNRAFATITGYLESESLGRTPGELLSSGAQDADFYRAMWEELQLRHGWHGEVVNRRRNGQLYTEWLSISVVPDAVGGVLHYIGLFTDISERKASEAYIHHLAYHDVLTGLANRLLFQDRLSNGLSQAHRSHRQLAVLLLDLDRFKVVNDTLGHQTGDQLLKQVAIRIAGHIREGDTLARLGGDEFALLMPEIQSTTDAANVARKLITALQPPVVIDGQDLLVTTSIGIAVYPAHGGTAEELIKHADMALYAAKDAGRNTWCFFDAASAGQSQELLQLEMDLRLAVTRRQLILNYQPQIGAKTGRVSGVEALVRWQHPVKGLISPALFIPLAEARGVIEEIGAWCLATACEQLARWKAEGVAVPRMAVNVSALQLRVPNFAQCVLATVAASGIHPAELELELTESSLTEDSAHAFTVFETLRAAGVRIAIDDFGTGYSSLSYLAQYPVDVVKIDQSFVRNIEDESEAPYIVQAVILLARGMKMESIAEGVETDGQRRKLIELGCDTLQGYFFARPCAAEAIPEFVGKLHAAVQPVA